MVSARRFRQFATVTLAVSLLLFAVTAFAAGPPKSSKAPSENQSPTISDQIILDDIGGGRCAVATPTSTPQGVQQIHVCNNWTGSPGANVEIFNTTGQSCTLTASTTTWPFVQSAPISIANGTGSWVTLLTTLHTGGTQYYYLVSCCPQDGLKSVTVP